MAKISVIVPIYKVEKYLKRCVDSILNQTYRDLEVILVDDGSPDGCPAMCDEYAKKDSRIKVVHKKNGGLSSARNAGMKMATGEYVSFIDSDDWIALDTYEYELGVIARTGADAVQVSFITAHDDNTVVPFEDESLKVFKDKDILQHYMSYSTRTGSYSVWKFLYKRDIVEGVEFREGKINEDMDYQYKVLSRAKTLVWSNQVKNFYFENIKSISNGGLVQRDFDLYDSAYSLVDLTKDETYGTIAYLGRVRLTRTPMSLLCKIAYWGIKDATIDKKKTVQRLTSEIRQGLPILLKAPMPLSRKVLSVLFAINYTMTEKLIHFAKWLSR